MPLLPVPGIPIHQEPPRLPAFVKVVGLSAAAIGLHSLFMRLPLPVLVGVCVCAAVAGGLAFKHVLNAPSPLFSFRGPSDVEMRWTLVSVTLAGVLLISAIALLEKALQLQPAAIPVALVPYISGGAVLVAGFAAHTFKRRNQYVYGMTETVFGVVSIFRLTQSYGLTGELIGQWTAFVGGSYIVARGLNNCQEAKKKESF